MKKTLAILLIVIFSISISACSNSRDDIALSKAAFKQTAIPITTPISTNQDIMINKEVIEKVTLDDYKPLNKNDGSQGEVVVINKIKEIIKGKPNVSKIVLEYTLLWSEKDYIKIIYYRNQKVLKRYAKSDSEKVWVLEEYKNVSDKEIDNATVIDGDLGNCVYSRVNEPEE